MERDGLVIDYLIDSYYNREYARFSNVPGESMSVTPNGFFRVISNDTNLTIPVCKKLLDTLLDIQERVINTASKRKII